MLILGTVSPYFQPAERTARASGGRLPVSRARRERRAKVAGNDERERTSALARSFGFLTIAISGGFFPIYRPLAQRIVHHGRKADRAGLRVGDHRHERAVHVELNRQVGVVCAGRHGNHRRGRGLRAILVEDQPRLL